MRERENKIGDRVSAMSSWGSSGQDLLIGKHEASQGCLLKDPRQQHLEAVAAVPCWWKVAPEVINSSSTFRLRLLRSPAAFLGFREKRVMVLT